jgi:hypothetical protein
MNAIVLIPLLAVFLKQDASETVLSLKGFSPINCAQNEVIRFGLTAGVLNKM